MECPRDGGGSASSRPPSATCSCSSTRSRPVVASVTGCSTCSRVFISRKKKSPRVVGHELDGARAGVADRGGGQPCGVEQLGAHARCPFDQRRGRLLDDLLVAPLNRAFALADGPHGAVVIGEHLDLDVVAGGQVALAEHRRITERRLRLTAGRFHLGRQFGQFADHAHPSAAAACRRLDQYRQLIGRHGVGIELVEHRHAGAGHHLLGLDLGAHRRHRGGRRADPRQARIR